MNLTRAAIKNNRVTTIALLVITFAGVSAFLGMPRAEDPGFVIRAAQVITHFPGASPSRVEKLVTDPLEKVIQEMPELDYVSSTSKAGVSVVNVSIKASYTDMRPIWDALRRKVDRARGALPSGIIGPAVNDEFGDVFGTLVSITGEGFSYAEIKEVADQLRDQLLNIEDASKVDIYGAQDERVFIEYDNATLSRLGLSPTQLAGILATSNIIVPGGTIEAGAERIALEPSGSFRDVEHLGETIINLPGRRGVAALRDVVKIRRGYVDPPASVMRTGRQRALTLAISLREGGDIIALGQEVKALLRAQQVIYPIGVELDVVAFQPDTVDRSVDDFVINLGQSVGIVLLVMLIFLGLRTGVLVASLIPMTILLTFVLMSVFGIGLNKVSLAALIIALGMLVDNAIVMSESVLVQMQKGKRAARAAIDSATELRLSLLTSSLTTASAFLPISLAESNVGEFTDPLFKVVAIALLSSWVLSLTMIPLLCAAFLKVKGQAAKEDAGFNSGFYRGYRGLLLGMVRRPLLTVLLMLGAFGLSLFGFRFIPAEFFPAAEKGNLHVTLRLPRGAPIERTVEAVEALEGFLAARQIPSEGGLNDLLTREAGPQGVINWGAFIGQGAPRFVLNYNPEMAAPEYAFLLVNLTSVEAAQALIAELEAFALEALPDADLTAKLPSSGPAAAHPIAVRLWARDQADLFELVEQTKAKLSALPGARMVDDDWGLWGKKLRVEINQTVARRAGISNQDVAISLQTALSGVETTQYREDDKIIPVTLRARAKDRLNPGRLESHTIYAQSSGVSVPLGQVARITPDFEPSVIKRRGRLQTVTLSAEVAEGYRDIGISAALSAWLEAAQPSWPQGAGFEMGGTAESSQAASQSIIDKLPIAGFLILILLVAQFNSMRRATIILATIPLALIGVVVGLLIARSHFGFMTFLGVISLAGIVINNAIVLIDRIKHEEAELGRSPDQAILEAAQRRLRPILLTTATTMGGLTPLWISGGPLWESMAVAIIFGLLFSTALTLGFVPALYALLFRVKVTDYTPSAPAAPR